MRDGVDVEALGRCAWVLYIGSFQFSSFKPHRLSLILNPASSSFLHSVVIPTLVSSAPNYRLAQQRRKWRTSTFTVRADTLNGGR